VSQAWILAGEQSGLQTHIAATESGSLCVRDEKLTAFLELESAIRGIVVSTRPLVPFRRPSNYDQSPIVQ
jgi:hypothetical protein